MPLCVNRMTPFALLFSISQSLFSPTSFTVPLLSSPTLYLQGAVLKAVKMWYFTGEHINDDRPLNLPTFALSATYSWVGIFQNVTVPPQREPFDRQTRVVFLHISIHHFVHIPLQRWNLSLYEFLDPESALWCHSHITELSCMHRCLTEETLFLLHFDTEMTFS